MNTRRTLAFLLCFLAVATTSLLAHHSAATEFDMNDPVSVEGVVVKVEWKNPHIWFYVDVAGEDGEMTTWGFTGSPPGMLARRGVTRDVLKVKVSSSRSTASVLATVHPMQSAET